MSYFLRSSPEAIDLRKELQTKSFSYSSVMYIPKQLLCSKRFLVDIYVRFTFSKLYWMTFQNSHEKSMCAVFTNVVFFSFWLLLQEDSTGSIYKSEILFSPVREVPLVSFSIDSLDCNEQDIMLTCQANKDNYTIAFEGSTIMDKSTDSHCHSNGPCNDDESKEKLEIAQSKTSRLNFIINNFPFFFPS